VLYIVPVLIILVGLFLGILLGESHLIEMGWNHFTHGVGGRIPPPPSARRISASTAAHSDVVEPDPQISQRRRLHSIPATTGGMPALASKAAVPGWPSADRSI